MKLLNSTVGTFIGGPLHNRFWIDEGEESPEFRYTISSGAEVRTYVYAQRTHPLSAPGHPVAVGRVLVLTSALVEVRNGDE